MTLHASNGEADWARAAAEYYFRQQRQEDQVSEQIARRRDEQRFHEARRQYRQMRESEYVEFEEIKLLPAPSAGTYPDRSPE